MEKEIFKNFIDVDAILSKKYPNLYKFMPKFILKWVKKTLHQDGMNDAIYTGGNLKDADFASHCITELKADFEGLRCFQNIVS